VRDARLNGQLSRLIQNRTHPETNLVYAFQLFSHRKYLSVELQREVDSFFNASAAGLRLLARRDKERALSAAKAQRGVVLKATSHRGSLDFPSEELLHVRGLVRTAIPAFAALCDRYETEGKLPGTRRQPATSQELSTWAQLQGMSAAEQLLALGPSRTAKRYLSAVINGFEFIGADRESKRKVLLSRNSGFQLHPTARESKTPTLGRVLHFAEVSVGPHLVPVARVELYESIGTEHRTQLHRVSFAAVLAGVRNQWVLASSLWAPVAFAEADAATKLQWVLPCGHV
jgi:hypothetical protein